MVATTATMNKQFITLDVFVIEKREALSGRLCAYTDQGNLEICGSFQLSDANARRLKFVARKICRFNEIAYDAEAALRIYAKQDVLKEEAEDYIISIERAIADGPKITKLLLETLESIKRQILEQSGKLPDVLMLDGPEYDAPCELGALIEQDWNSSVLRMQLLDIEYKLQEALKLPFTQMKKN